MKMVLNMLMEEQQKEDGHEGSQLTQIDEVGPRLEGGSPPRTGLRDQQAAPALQGSPGLKSTGATGSA